MDIRDKHLARYHQRRLKLSRHLPVAIQKIWARRAISVAKAQNRFLMLALGLKWLHEIERVNE